MKFAKVFVSIAVLVMGWVLVQGFIKGDLQAEGSIIGGLPWGVVSLVDVYIGFFLFSGWVIYREKRIGAALLWVLLIMIFGNFITSVYTLLALFQSGESWKKFWLGKNFQM